MTLESSGGDHLPVPIDSNSSDLAGKFDYSGLPPDATNELLERRTEIIGAVKKTTEAIIVIGRDLIAAKKILGHGRFVPWVEVECGFSVRSAQNYMAISRLSIKNACVAHLPIQLTLRLARTRGRFEFLDRISANIVPGRRPTEEEVCELLEKFRTMRSLRPKRPRGRRRAPIKPIERPSEKLGGLTKTESARKNVEYIRRTWGNACLYAIRSIYDTDTLAETLPIIEAIISRIQFEAALMLQRSAIEEEEQSR
jgi:hypothetical protein